MKRGVRACMLGVAWMWSACSTSVTTPTSATPAQPNRSVPATAPATFIIAGSVEEPGQGGVGEVRVLDTASSISTHTGQGGRFELVGLPNRKARLRLEKDGYEPAELGAASGTIADGRIQQMIRLIAGETVMPHRLAPNDLTYQVAPTERCHSCRLVRIVVPTDGTLHLDLTWTRDCPDTLALWIDGQHIVPSAGRTEVTADVRTTAGETIVYVDRVVSPVGPVCHTPFVLATSLSE